MSPPQHRPGSPARSLLTLAKLECGRTPRRMIVVAHTCPPRHLARIGRLDLIPAVVGRVLVGQTVWGRREALVN